MPSNFMTFFIHLVLTSMWEKESNLSFWLEKDAQQPPFLFFIYSHLNFQFVPSSCYILTSAPVTACFLAANLVLHFLRVYKTNTVMWFFWQTKHSCKERWMGCQFSLSWDLHLVTQMRTERTCHRGETGQIWL